ncbi:molybdenum cofactor guanylyltransferase [Nocardioides sp.]|uniref:molybdenum cofactor guanylyltransferase n=1 Tax=Nocardioides sp. TaxID=35761 RepID=UPI002BFB7780|nr:NTP transferase domain-containing protein [Nocardioides sp.]HXH80179.1 NTP transferase domain-containing protein [Nocardioides sp.]
MDFDLGAAGFCGVLLTGGTAARMDGIDKSGLELGGRTLLEISLDAFLDADEVVVVGPPTVPTARPVTFTREDPPFGGPVAGLLTGVDALLRPARLIGVLAVDMPHVSSDTFRRLRTACAGRDGAFLVDETGRRQLCGVLDAAALARVRPGLQRQHNMALRALLVDLDLAELPGIGNEPRDIDTWADLRDHDA